MVPQHYFQVILEDLCTFTSIMDIAPAVNKKYDFTAKTTG